MKRMLLLGVFLLSTFLTFAQDRRVTGKVAGSDGQGIPGVSVLLKGTQTGTSTDANGAFAINLKSGKDVLAFSGIGFKSVEVKVGTQSSVNVTLNEDVSSLDEVVVTGYSSSNKKESTAAISTVKAKDLVVAPSGNVEQQLQGRVAGLTLITNGQPGTSSIIRVRGFGAFGGNEPLYVVDGVPVGSTDFLSPNDIESTTVLKDAAAASIYGARAANGVIVYTTKKGAKRARKMEVTYDGLFGVTDPNAAGAPKNLTPQEQADWTKIAQLNNISQNGIQKGTEAYDNALKHPQYGNGEKATLPAYLYANGQSGVYGSVDLAAAKAAYDADPANTFLIKPNLAGTDWYAAITRSAPLMRHNLGFSGGTENGRYYFGLSLQDQAGILINNNYKRYAFRANSEFDLGKRVRIGENLQFTYRSVTGQAGRNNGQGIADEESPVLAAYRMPSIIPIFDEFGSYASTKAAGFNNPRNPVRSLTLNNGNDNNFNGNAFGNIYVEVDPVANLTLRSSIGGQFNNYYYKDYNYRYLGDSEPEASNAFFEGAGYNFAWTFTNTATYKNKFGKHGVTAQLGIESLNTGFGRQINGSGINPFSTDLNYVNLSKVNNPQVNSGLYNGVNFYSLFGEAKYSYNDKYYVTGVVRRDGSSRFGANSRYGIFPAFSAAWRVSSEDFMKDLPFITDLKIRGGWGQMGNSNNVDPGNQYSLFGSDKGSSYYPISGTNNGADEGYYRTRIGNPDAKWETSTTANIGIDATFLNGRLEAVVDFWSKDTKDLLYNVPIAAVVGPLASAPSVNIASMSNKGIDIQLIGHGKIGSEVRYDLTWNSSILSNKITYLAPGIDFFGGGGYRGVSPIRNAVGQPISSFFGYKQIGYFGSAEDVKNSPAQSGAGIGRFKYADTNGDGKITPDDRTFIGNPVPDYTGGIVLDLKYKSWSVSTYLYTSLGNKIFNFSKWYTGFYGTFEGSGKGAIAKDSWTPALGNSAKAPIWESASNISTSGAENSWYVENGSYLRMTNLTVGYDLPTAITSKLGIKKAKLTASTTNLFTITGYSGLDPGVGGAADTNFGIDVGNYPVSRGFNLGVNLSF
jgi:TonB-dependent starch-binding outer membrane protein SusC